MKLNYIIIFVSDMKRSISFYKDILGIPLKFESTDWSEFSTEGATLALHLSDIKANPNINSKIAGQSIPGFSVKNIEKFHQKMIDNNVTCNQLPQNVFGSIIAQYKDPDELLFSVSEEKI